MFSYCVKNAIEVNPIVAIAKFTIRKWASIVVMMIQLKLNQQLLKFEAQLQNRQFLRSALAEHKKDQGAKK
jgi:hypothetical protein